jgi:hypothetical protein
MRGLVRCMENLLAESTTSKPRVASPVVTDDLPLPTRASQIEAMRARSRALFGSMLFAPPPFSYPFVLAVILPVHFSPAAEKFESVYRYLQQAHKAKTPHEVITQRLQAMTGDARSCFEIDLIVCMEAQ